MQKHLLYRVVLSLSLLFSLAVSCSTALAEWTRDQMMGQEQGKTVYRALPVDDAFKNVWPEKLEAEFQARARQILSSQSEIKLGVNTYFENEKRTYGYLMANLLTDNWEEALDKLQQQDHQHEVWHKETDGIDYYACFTIKHQTRKYFYFGDLLSKDYKKQMFSGAKKWTAKDPMRRPHYAHKAGIQGWGPDAKNSWVDIRSTENLFLMRNTSVYLFAEETGNKETTAKYKKLFLDYTKTLYRIGMGEWDSENYHGHSIAPLLNLYDFAKDKEVKLAAKACLDYMMTIGAVKYYRGGFNGPSKRDYNHAQPFGGSAAAMLWVYFGDTPKPNAHWESDEVHIITSAYRPPLAVVKLARKELDLPVVVTSSKPEYSATTSLQFESKPEYLETNYLGHSFLMGSLSGGTTPGKSDVSGFKILAYDKHVGARAIQIVPGKDPLFPGSPLYQEGKVAAENRVAQYGNLAIWLAKSGTAPWNWVLPDNAKVSTEKGVTFIELDRTWIAATPVGCADLKADAAGTAAITTEKKPRFPEHMVLSSQGKGKSYCGFVIEVGEKETHKNFDAFRKAVLSAELDTSQLEAGIVQYKTPDGRWLGYHWNDNTHDLGVWKNGSRHDWEQHAQFMYRSERPAKEGWEFSPSPIHAVWGEGKLTVTAGGEQFECAVDSEGKVAYSNSTVKK